MAETIGQRSGVLIEKLESDMEESLTPGDFFHHKDDDNYYFYVACWFYDDKILASITCTFHDGAFYDNELKKINVSKYLIDNSK
jgi:hypothetical protein